MFRRLLALIRKELQIVTGDRKTLRLLIGPVILQTILFPFAATMEVRNATVAVYSQDAGRASTEVVQRLARTSAFTRVEPVGSLAELERAIDGERALIGLVIPPDFGRRASAGQAAPVQLILDGRRSNSAQVAAGYATQVIAAFGGERGGAGGPTVAVRHLHNPNLHSAWHVLPSLVAIITTIGCLFVTGLSVAREREEGTFDQLLVSPLTPAYIMAGKAVPGVLVAFLQGAFIALAAHFGFGIPFTGSVVALAAGILLYGVALSGIGLYISSICMTQQQAFFGVFAFMSPAVLLSGYVSPVENMPWVLRMIAHANPLTHVILVAKGTFLKGWGLADALPHLWPLVLIAVVTLSAALALFRRHIA